MIPVFVKMRRKDRQITTEEACAILLHGEYGVLSLFDDEFPYGIPVNYVYMNHAVYFHCAPEGHKLQCIQQNPKVSFCVVRNVKRLPEILSTAYESAVIFGKACIVEGEEKRNALWELVKKYAPHHAERGTECIEKEWENTKVVKIEILHISGKANRANFL